MACWSAKGGSGVTVVAAALGLLLGRASPAGALLVDLGGDLPLVLGVPQPPGPGVVDWLEARAEPDALDRLAVEVTDRLRLVPRGRAGVAADAERLADVLVGREPVIVDCGSPGSPLGLAVAAVAPTSLLVIRPCLVSLRRAAESSVRPTGVVVVEEYGRAIGYRDVAAAVGAPLAARLPWDPKVARAVDSGLLTSRLPRPLVRGLRRVVRQ